MNDNVTCLENADTVFVRCPAHLAFVGLLRQTVATLCGDAPLETERYQVQLAVSELVTNIVTHAYSDGEGGTIEFAATCGGSGVTIDVYDTGETFVASESSTFAPALPPDPHALLEGGYGLFIIGQTMDVLTHTREADDRNHWHLEKRFGAIAA